MGANISRDNCCGARGREVEQDAVESSDLLSWAESIGLWKSLGQADASVDTSAAPIKQSATHDKKDDELQCKISAIMDRVKQRKKSTLPCLDDELKDRVIQDRINDAVRARAERQIQSPIPSVSRDDLQNQINVIVQAHAESLNQQRQLSTEMASPSPARSVSKEEIAHIANLALSGAKDRKTPATSPAPLYFNSPAHGSEVVRRQLNFADCDGASASQKMSDEVKTSRCNLIEIPSPSRNVAKSHPWGCDRGGASQPTFPVKDSWHEMTEDEESKARRQTAGKKETAEAEKATDEEIALMAEMDKMCVMTFLECVKKCAWREKVRTPIKGTNLYIKHMRPCRPCGTSVDVKDSNFKNLRNFLQFLEAEGLLRLQPGLSDPVVTEIRFKACRDYEYVPRTVE